MAASPLCVTTISKVMSLKDEQRIYHDYRKAMSPPNEALSMYTTMSCIVRMCMLYWRKCHSAVLIQLLWLTCRPTPAHKDRQSLACRPQRGLAPAPETAWRSAAAWCCCCLDSGPQWPPPQPCRCPAQLWAAQPQASPLRQTAASSTSPPEQARSRRSLASLLHRSVQHRQQVMHTWDASHIGESLSY